MGRHAVVITPDPDTPGWIVYRAEDGSGYEVVRSWAQAVEVASKLSLDEHPHNRGDRLVVMVVIGLLALNDTG